MSVSSQALMVTLCLLVCRIATFGGDPLFISDDWENGISPEMWSTQTEDPGGLTVVETTDSHFRSGAFCLKAVLDNKYANEDGPGIPLADTTYKRAEVAHTYRADIGNQYFYRFSIFLPDNSEETYPRNNNDANPACFTIIAQWHGVPDFGLGEHYRYPNLSFGMNENGELKIHSATSSLQVNTNADATKISHVDSTGNSHFAVPKNQWVTFEVSVDWQYDSSGSLVVHMDDELLVDYTGPTCYNDQTGPYLKFGIYRTPWFKEKETIYYDNLTMLKNGVIIQPDRDAFVRGGSFREINYGSSNTLMVKANTDPYWRRESYLHYTYDSYADFAFTSGLLYLSLNSEGPAALLLADRVDDAWDESSITFSSAENLAYLGQAGSIPADAALLQLPIPSLPVSTSELSLRLSLDLHNAVFSMPSRETSLETRHPLLFLLLE